jgi:hypothetical protein
VPYFGVVGCRSFEHYFGEPQKLPKTEPLAYKLPELIPMTNDFSFLARLLKNRHLPHGLLSDPQNIPLSPK